MIFLFLNLCFSLDIQAQELVANQKSLKVGELPEYVVIHTGFFYGSIRITIQSKESPNKKALEDLELILEDDKYLNIKNQTDLLNAMSELGFDFQDAFGIDSGDYGFLQTGLVFRKKEKYRN